MKERRKDVIIALFCFCVLCLMILYFLTRDYRTLGDITYLQEATSTICANTTQNQPYNLIDQRDQKSYSVAKLEDGKCWFLENLALELSADRTLTNLDTDLHSTTAWTPSNTITTWANDNTKPYSRSTDNNVYYNWTASIASNDSSNLTARYHNAPDSICPKGWRLPKVHDGSKYAYPNEFAPIATALSLDNEFYWSATIYNDINAYHANIDSPGSNNRSDPALIRCVAR